MTARSRNKLSARFVLKKDLKQGRYSDGANLYLNITPTGTKNWILIATKDGVRREVGLGSVNDVTLENAREKAAALRKAAANGEDVLTAKRVGQSIITYEQAARKYVEAMQSSWKPAVAKRWLQILASDEMKTLNKRPVRDIGLQDVLRPLNALWQQKPTTGQQLANQIKRVLTWSAVHGYRDPNIANPADWETSLKHVMASPKRGGHFEAMPYADVPKFYRELRKIDTTYSRSLELIILLWTRKREVLDMVWSEVDFEKAIWTLPAERAKSGRQHEFPLTRRAIEILRAQHRLTGGNGFVFPSTWPGRAISSPTLMRYMPRPYSVHGMRSAARDWAGNETNHARETAEEALSHVVGDSTERAYRRGRSLEKMGALLKDWQTYLEG